MKNLKKLVLGTALFCASFGAFSSHADPEDHARIRQCQNTDAACAGEVVLGAIEKMEGRLSMRGGGGRGRGGGGFFPPAGPAVPLVEKVVEFYTSDKCTQGLQGTIKMSNDWDENLARCDRFLATFTNAAQVRIYGVKVDGQCQDIDDTTLNLACPRYAQP